MKKKVYEPGGGGRVRENFFFFPALCQLASRSKVRTLFRLDIVVAISNIASFAACCLLPWRRVTQSLSYYGVDGLNGLKVP